MECKLIKEKLANELADFLIECYDKTKVPEDKQYFSDNGFTGDSLTKDIDNLFKFTILVGYDRRPFFPFEIVWNLDRERSVSNVLNQLGIFSVSKMQNIPMNELDELLENSTVENNYHLNSDKRNGRGTKFAQMIKELSHKTTELRNNLLSVNNELDVIKLHRYIDNIHGFGVTLASKFIMYTLREIQLRPIDYSYLAYAAEGLKGELHNTTWCEMIVNQHGQIYFNEMLYNLKRDPMAFDYIFYLDRYYCNRKSCSDCVAQ